ncbi:ATP-dependent protease subunit HslV [Natranaerobius thermophilus]|uniref:CodW component of CodWX peptidase. Threonine peptidase. MEROPS family T01B n=1 Tax=Natranaerobius thermophilus (strain ATCC BAA-1301 / DSM 18059 / JW/NM-WN-LF) TaxID=457570 RepID=B2A336_NATTJ|nr:ATP-dependent protease subunit HslV [Natranaerobius thermophilus]ACB84967.1 CodW component of CodWX peptidase. Threonine peptidase. MEROPS family T01B [Natranaerobius thermophilus JW/NM-WN-LF]
MLDGTTIAACKTDKGTAIAGDGQITMGQNTIFKQSAKKIWKLYKGEVLAGFAGSVADAMTLFERFEHKLEQEKGNLSKASVELAKEWRSDKVLRRLEALLLVANLDKMFIISGSGEIIEPDDNVAAIGSGGAYALSALKMLSKHSDLAPGEMACEALNTAAEICVYTNSHISVEELRAQGD